MTFLLLWIKQIIFKIKKIKQIIWFFFCNFWIVNVSMFFPSSELVSHTTQMRTPTILRGQKKMKPWTLRMQQIKPRYIMFPNLKRKKRGNMSLDRSCKVFDVVLLLFLLWNYWPMLLLLVSSNDFFSPCYLCDISINFVDY